jgi:hypothetical protein
MLKGKLTDISKGEVDTDYRIVAPLRKWRIHFAEYLNEYFFPPAWSGHIDF